MQRFVMIVLIASFLLLALSGKALAEEGTIHLRVSPGASWVISEISPIFDDSATVKIDGGYELVDGVIGQLSYTYFRLISENILTIDDANVNSICVGVRVLPLEWFDEEVPMVPWLDLNLGWYRLFSSDEFGLNIGLGVEFVITEYFRFGPFFRYDHVVLDDDTNDFKIVSTGVTFAFGYKPGGFEKESEPIPKPSKK